MKETSYLEIRLDEVHSNMQKIRDFAPGAKVMGILKCDAYGYGLEAIAQNIEADKIGVGTVHEVRRLKEIGYNSVQLYPPPSWEIEPLVQDDAEITVDRFDTIEQINAESLRQNKRTKIHLQVEAGMNRYGMEPQDVVAVLQKAQEMPAVAVEGLCTHFSAVTRNPKTAVTQFHRFMEVFKRVAEANIHLPTVHIANSASIVEYPDTIDPRTFTSFMPNVDLYIRPGSLLYGMHLDKKVGTKQILSGMYSHITEVKNVAAGETVGYGQKFVAKEPTQVATIPVGHGHGFLIQNGGDILINGVRSPIVGYVSATTFAVVNNGEGSREDRVTIIGKEKDEEITLAEVSDNNGLLQMQLMESLGAKLPKQYIT